MEVSFFTSSPLTGLKRVCNDTGSESIIYTLPPRWNDRNLYKPKLTRSGTTALAYLPDHNYTLYIYAIPLFCCDLLLFCDEFLLSFLEQCC